MKNILAAMVAVFILGGCVSYQHEHRFGAAGGGYYVAESPPSGSYYYAPYWSLYGYGITPWWGYTYHSPYFYPHDFHLWYAPWPYYAAWPYYSPWYAATFHRHPAYHRQAPPPGGDRADGGAGAPLPDYSGTPYAPPGPPGGQWRPPNERGRWGEPRYGGPGAGLPVDMSKPRGLPPRTSLLAPAPANRAGSGPGVTTGIVTRASPFGAPLVPAAGSRPAIGGRASPVRFPESGPAPHDQ